ncbi:MAG: hypothetical protein JWO06_4036 [Bacteroidota bacterium]|nr:hypothetical protein [Bacteroidota bacterium]
MKYFFQLLLVLIVLDGCSNQAPNKKESLPAVATANDTSASKLAVQSRPVRPDSVLNDYSLFLAGMSTGNNVAPKLVKNNFYKKYRAEMDSNFARIKHSRLNIMDEWANGELAAERTNPTVLFYPFSGPDILHAITLYPNATEYVMIAMEKPGDIPDIHKMDSASSAYYLNSVYQSLQDIFQKSYFITRKMIEDLQKVKVNGVAPLLCVFLERTGHTVVAMKKNHLNDDGTTSVLASDSLPNHVNDFIEIYFRTEGSDAVRKMVYFRANLGDQDFSGLPSLKSNKTLQNYFNGLPDFYMYTKSASYLMNYGTFSVIRDICLNKSKSILQDDTGIGFGYFEPNKWKIQLYGNFAKPVRDFKGINDSKLEEAYKKDPSKVKSLKFSLGYHWGNKNDQNLMKAVRVK